MLTHPETLAWLQAEGKKAGAVGKFTGGVVVIFVCQQEQRKQRSKISSLASLMQHPTLPLTSKHIHYYRKQMELLRTRQKQY